MQASEHRHSKGKLLKVMGIGKVGEAAFNIVDNLFATQSWANLVIARTLKMDLWKTVFLYSPVAYRFHVSLLTSTASRAPRLPSI